MTGPWRTITVRSDVRSERGNKGYSVTLGSDKRPRRILAAEGPDPKRSPAAWPYSAQDGGSDGGRQGPTVSYVLRPRSG